MATHATHAFAEPVALTTGSLTDDAPLVVLLHGRGSDERAIMGLAKALTRDAEYVALRAPIAEGGGYAWFENRGIGRPVAESLAATTAWFEDWLDALLAGEASREVDGADERVDERPIVLIGFSGGAAFAGGLVLRHPERYAGAAVLNGTLPFDAGVPTTPGRLEGTRLFVAQGDGDTVIPRELLDRTWEYAVVDSGAEVATHRSAGGHGLEPEVVDALAAWLDEVLGTSVATDGD